MELTEQNNNHIETLTATVAELDQIGPRVMIAAVKGVDLGSFGEPVKTATLLAGLKMILLEIITEIKEKGTNYDKVAELEKTIADTPPVLNALKAELDNAGV